MQIVETYKKWCDNYSEDHAIVIFGTIWRSTEKMAKAIAEGMEAGGLKTCLIEAALMDKNDLVTEVFKAKAMMIGSSTISNSVVTSIAVILHEIKALKYKGKTAAAFGSFGWSGESGKLITDALKESGNTIALEPLMVKYNPTCDDLDKCIEFGRAFAKAIKEKEGT
jgi:flavorubredoxin